jgi:hypothetical protein
LVIETHINDSIEAIRADYERFGGTGHSSFPVFQQQVIGRLLWDLRSFGPLGASVESTDGAVTLPVSLTDLQPKLRYLGHGTRLDNGQLFQLSQPVRAPQLTNSLGPDAIIMAWTTELGDRGVGSIRKITIMVDARRLFASVLQPGRSGTTGELYAFDSAAWMISDSRFNQHLYQIGMLESGREAALAIKVADPGMNLLASGNTVSSAEHSNFPMTDMAKSATKGESGHNIKGYRDYRGVPVVGVWQWFPNYGFGITHEIDQDEAYANIETLNVAFLTIMGLLMLATVAMVWFAAHARSLTR